MNSYLYHFALLLWVPGGWLFSCPDLFDNVTKIYEQRLHSDQSLWENFNVNSFDPASNFFSEVTPKEVFRKADILIDYQKLMREALFKNDASCNTTKLNGIQNTLARMTECVPEELRCSSHIVDCNNREKWRNYDGSCNNPANPKWGAQNMEYSRLLNANYDDGINSIRRCAKSNEDLISPRIIGNTINSAKRKLSFEDNYPGNETVQNVFAVMFGQAIAHDIGKRTVVAIKGDGANGIRCCSKSYDKVLSIDQRNSQCIPINVPKNDEFYGKRNIGCLNFVRAQSTLANDCKVEGVPKMNTVSAYLDMNIVYSNAVDQMQSMRNMSGGLFSMNANNILPEGQFGYVAGDGRVNQTPWLISTHSLLFRLHNYIAGRLAGVNKHWNDERLFNESRRINIAIYEHLIYDEWLPTFVGREYSEMKNLTCRRQEDACGAYDANIDASTMAEFAHASFRLFHTYVPADVNFIANDGNKLKTIKLSDTIEKPTLIENNFNNLLRGMLYDPLETRRPGYSKQLRNLFEKNGCGIGIDVFSLDVMRGRDFGVSPYIDFFVKCGHNAVKSWKDLKGFFSDSNLQLLMRIYADIEDIDLLVGMLLEYKSIGRHGVLGGCILAEQFYRLKTGNRFFYTFEDSPYPFAREQIRAISDATFAKVICWTTDMSKVPEKSLEIPGDSNPLIDCNSFTELSLNSFQET